MAIDKIQSESINLADNFAFTGTVTGAGGVNTPNFFATKSDGNQAINDATNTQVTFNNELIDSDSAYASNTFTVPSGEAGVYQVSTSVNFYDSTGKLKRSIVYIYKNDQDEIHETARAIQDLLSNRMNPNQWSQLSGRSSQRSKTNGSSDELQLVKLKKTLKNRQKMKN